MKTDLINKAVQMEWDFLQTVQNIGGRASCQNDWINFEKYRKSQFEVYENEVLESYISDLNQYKELNYNPIMLKYAYMMETNDTEAFDKISDNLPKVEDEKLKLIKQLVIIELEMREKFGQEFPKIANNARTIYTNADNQSETSFETYLRAELSTYSFKTLYLYAQMLVEMMKNERNIVKEIQENTVKKFGFESLEDAELNQ